MSIGKYPVGLVQAIPLYCSRKQFCFPLRPLVDVTTHLNEVWFNISTHVNACTPDTTCSYLGRDGVYIYTKDLLDLEQAPQKEQSSIVNPRLAGVHTPLHLAAWSKKLHRHPDKDFSNYILRGIENGFHIGINPAVSLKPATRNMQSASQHPEVIDDYLQKELLQE